jgi:hypothetical protein
MLKQWGPAMFTAARYVIYSMFVALQAWLISVKERWADISTWDWWSLACALSLAGLTALGAVMNDSWSKAKGTQ